MVQTQKDLGDQIVDLKTKVDDLTKSGAVKDSEIANLQKVNADLKLQLDAAASASAAKEKALSDQIAKLEASGLVKDSEIALLKDQLNKTTADAAAMQSSLQQQIADLQAQLAAYQQP